MSVRHINKSQETQHEAKRLELEIVESRATCGMLFGVCMADHMVLAPLANSKYRI